MSVLSIVMLVASIFFLYLVIRNINKNNILFEQAFMWIVIAFLQTMTLSKQKEQIKHLVQELSILKSHVEEKEEKNEG